jgi:hypothetical protein
MADWIEIAIVAAGNRLMAGSSSGEIAFFDIRNLECGPAICTPARHGTCPAKVSCRRPLCSQSTEVPEQAAEAIEFYMARLTPNQSPCLELPDSAFHDARLHANCSACARAIQFNPFFVVIA